MAGSAPGGPDLLATLAPLLADPSAALVACDYDGTLAPIVDDPASALPFPGAVEVLGRLARLVGRVAVVTGRPAGDVVAIAGLDAVPGLVVLGLYGDQRYQAGVLTAGPPPPGLAAAEADVRRLLDSPAYAGAVLEHKGGSFAVHTRRARQPGRLLADLDQPLRAVAAAHGLRAEAGRLVLELRGAGTDKGVALRALVDDPPARRSVLYAGDDLADLVAFEVVEALRRGGRSGWTVAAANTEAPAVAAAADVVVDGPGGVVALLGWLADELTAG